MFEDFPTTCTKRGELLAQFLSGKLVNGDGRTTTEATTGRLGFVPNLPCLPAGTDNHTEGGGKAE